MRTPSLNEVVSTEGRSVQAVADAARLTLEKATEQLDELHALATRMDIAGVQLLPEMDDR